MSVVSGYCGTSGRVKLVAIAPDLTTDTPTYAGTPATFVEFESWQIDAQQSGDTSLTTFESDGNAEGSLAEQELRGGKHRWTARAEAAETTNLGGILVGQFYYADFLLQKGAATGRKNCKVKVVGIGPGTGVSQPHAKNVISFKGSGLLPAVS